MKVRYLIPLMVVGLSLTLPVSVMGQECVDLNSASVRELQRIIHIGPQRARQIVVLREQRPFRVVDEIVRVRGIASARLRDIKAQGITCVRPPGSDFLGSNPLFEKNVRHDRYLM